jgi:multidrug resistance protein, MATE family
LQTLVALTAETGVFLGATLCAATLGAAEVAAHTLTLRMAGFPHAVAGLRPAAARPAPACRLLARRVPLGLVLCEVQALGVTGLWTGLVAGAATTAVLSLLRLPGARDGLAARLGERLHGRAKSGMRNRFR